MGPAHVPGLSVAVVDDRGLRHVAAYGFADLGASTPATPLTSYLWFSMTKIATATVALRLADQGRLDLDAPIRRYVDGYRRTPGPDEARVGQLLDHTAGVANPLPLRWVRPASQPAPDPATFLARVLRRHGNPRYEVGGAARYSNLGYLLLGQAIASAAGAPLTEVVTDELLTPAMGHTGFAPAADRDQATGYIRIPRPTTPLLRAFLPAGVVGARHGALGHRHLSFRPFLVDGASYGGLVGDVVDAGRLATLHLADGVIDGHRVLESDTARRMRRITSPGRPFDLGQGWFRHAAHGEGPTDHVEHLGTGAGFRNVMRLYPDRGLGVVIMTNTTAAYDHHSFCERLVRLPW